MGTGRIVLAALALLAVHERAMATHGDNAPKRAGKMVMALVQGQATCLAPNDSAGAVTAYPACHPAVPADSLCGFTSSGIGKMSLLAGRSDVRVKVRVVGLAPTCNGQTLCAIATLRLTTDDCTSGDAAGCTSLDTFDAPLAGCCTVTAGMCRIATSLNDAVAGSVTGGNAATYEIRGCGLSRITAGPEPPLGPALRCGLLVP